MRERFLLIVLTSLASTVATHAQPSDFPSLVGPYLGQDRPGGLAELFAPGIVANAHHEHSAAIFSPDGEELFWTQVFTPLQSPTPAVILWMRCVDGVWTEPEVAPFSGQYNDGVGFFSPDGDRLYFSSGRPRAAGGEPDRYTDIWYVDRTDDGWSEPQWLDSEINTERYESAPQVVNSGSMYFLGHLPGVAGEYGIFRSRLVGGKYATPEPLGPNINSEYNDWCPYVDPDEEYIVFSSNRPGGCGRLDLYISFRQVDDEFGEAINLGIDINSEDNDRFPCISPDGEYLFFLSKRTPLKSYFSEPQTYRALRGLSGEILNGLSNIYWADWGIIKNLRPDAN